MISSLVDIFKESLQRSIKKNFGCSHCGHQMFAVTENGNYMCLRCTSIFGEIKKESEGERECQEEK